MRKLALAAAGALASAAVLVGAGQASSSGYYYLYTYFSDASKTTVVGYNNQSCQPGGHIVDNISGTVTAHSTQSILGYCSAGGGGPL